MTLGMNNNKEMNIKFRLIIEINKFYRGGDTIAK